VALRPTCDYPPTVLGCTGAPPKLRLTTYCVGLRWRFTQPTTTLLLCWVALALHPTYDPTYDSHAG